MGIPDSTSIIFKAFHRLSVSLGAIALGGVATMSAAEITEAMWQDVVAANAQLRAVVEAQQKEIMDLRARVDRLDQANQRNPPELATLHHQLDRAPDLPVEPATKRSSDGLIFSGEAGVGFFAGQENTEFNNAEFRLDEATLRLDAEVARGIYGFGELQLTQREASDETFHLGEFYLELESIGLPALPDRALNLRVGRLDIPFGEEYQRRNALANPLITHSVSDVWGTDEGIEFFGWLGRTSYVIAVQNGNASTLRDFTRDKSVTARLGFAATPRLHLSASYMRTGELDAVDDFVSEIWIGNVVFRSIGSEQTTRFRADIVELDATWSWRTGQVWGAIGRAHYSDNDPLANNQRDFDFYQFEIVQGLTPRLYAAARYSALEVDGGYPFAGLGNVSAYFFGPWTTELHRLSLGGGYRFNPQLALKLEYAFENGRLRNGNNRDESDQFSAAAVFGF